MLVNSALQCHGFLVEGIHTASFPKRKEVILFFLWGVGLGWCLLPFRRGYVRERCRKPSGCAEERGKVSSKNCTVTYLTHFWYVSFAILPPARNGRCGFVMRYIEISPEKNPTAKRITTAVTARGFKVPRRPPRQPLATSLRWIFSICWPRHHHRW